MRGRLLLCTPQRGQAHQAQSVQEASTVRNSPTRAWEGWVSSHLRRGFEPGREGSFSRINA